MAQGFSTTEVFLLAMLVILAVPWLVWRLGHTDRFAPLVVVQIIGGILLGPGVLGAAYPDYYAFIFRPDVVTALNGIAWWAVMLFVWFAGIELDLRAAWADRRQTGVTAGLTLAVPMILGSAAALFLLRQPGWIGAAAAHWQAVLGIGMACTVTALPILVLFMEKLGMLRAPLGQRILRYASLDDIAVWAVLALILVDWERVGRQLAFLALFALASILIRKLMQRIPLRDRWYLGIVWVAAVGFAADWSGLHFMVGAFLAGVVLDQDMFGQAELDRFRDYVLLAFMPIFFLSTGLRTQWSMGGADVIGAAALLLAVSVAGKMLGAWLAGWLLGWKRGESTVIGLLLQTKALIMIIFVNILLDKQVISSAAFTALLLMAAVSTMITIPTVTPRLKALLERG